MTLKGQNFAEIIPESMKPGGRTYNEGRTKRWVAENNKRWAVVGQCEDCGRDLVAEEVAPHRLNHVPERLRALARDVYALSAEDRVELFGHFTRTGKLKGAE